MNVLEAVTAPATRRALQRAIDDPDASMTHSWLFTGPPGSGRSVAAKAFATALVCSNGGCGECEQCQSARSGTHPDIEWVATSSQFIKVAQVREVIQSAAKMPTVGRWRVVVIEDADRLNASAANALLKSVEEPPKRTVFLLCAPSTDPQDIAITLRSRCRHVYVPTPAPAQVATVLLQDESMGLTPEQAEWAASVSGGHIGRARRLARDEQARDKRASALKLPRLVYEGSQVYQFTAELVKKATDEVAASVAELEAQENRQLEESFGVGAKGRGAAKATRGAAGAIKELKKEQSTRRDRMLTDSLDLALIDVAGLYRDAMLIAAGAVDMDGAPVGGFQHPDMAATSGELARRNSAQALLDCIDAVGRCRETLLHTNIKPEVALGGLAGTLRECCGAV